MQAGRCGEAESGSDERKRVGILKIMTGSCTIDVGAKGSYDG
jgi:hypothetical protein